MTIVIHSVGKAPGRAQQIRQVVVGDAFVIVGFDQRSVQAFGVGKIASFLCIECSLNNLKLRI